MISPRRRWFASSLLPRLESLTGTAPAQEASASVIGRLLGREQSSEVASRPPLADDAMPEQEKTWLFLAVTGATVALTRNKPLLLVLDDLHWADGPTVGPLIGRPRPHGRRCRPV